MGFFIQDQKSQRNIERFIIILYAVYTINLCIGVIRRGGEVWIPGFMLMVFFVSLSLFLSKYKNAQVRAAITAVMIQISFFLYAKDVEDLSAVIPTFMVLVLIAALYGHAQILWITVVFLLFNIFYHGVITENLRLLPRETLFYLLFQLGNIVCMEGTLYIWLKHRSAANEAMYQMVEALIEAEQSKDDFLSNVSHEIRTPVNTICGMSELALRETNPDRMREEVFNIRDAGNNLMSLVSDILDFSQLQQGKMDIEEESYNLASTVNDIINMAMARKGDKPIELIVDCDANIPSRLSGDEKKIRRVIMNLVDNAIKFTNEGGVIIRVSFRREIYGVNLCVTVKDTGIGMSEVSQEKLFESFSQVDTRRNRQEGGVGLGLAIAKALIRKMGGTITVKSRLGKGSIFRFVVPQKVLDEKPIGRIEDRERLNIAAYFDMEQFDMMTIRDEYSTLILHMVQQLQVRCHVCRNLAELKRRESYDPFTHVFISLEEYQEDEAYFDGLAKHVEVIIVIDRPREKYLSNPDIVRLYKPFHILPVVSILNGSRDCEGGRQIVRPGKFTAPDVHVLVVDDNLMNIRVVEGLLKEYGIRVSYAASGQEALELIENMCYDLVFMDHMMPEMDGIEVLHRIRDKAGNYYQRVPIIALTANAAPGNREMFLEEGFNDFVAKPIEISVLERVLSRNLPEERLVFQAKQENEEAKDDAFAISDLEVDKGLLYCGGKQAYLDILDACYRENARNRQLLEDLFQRQDWKNYTVKVHALKSTMENIGAMALAQKARALEMAGKKNDIAYITDNHTDMLDEYRRLMDGLAQSPLLHLEPSEEVLAIPSSEPGSAGQDDLSGLQELDDAAFDGLLAGLEDAMYSLDGEGMLAILSRMQECQYCKTALKDKLSPIRKKIEMSDYMSAVDAISQMRDKLRNS